MLRQIAVYSYMFILLTSCIITETAPPPIEAINLRVNKIPYETGKWICSDYVRMKAKLLSQAGYRNLEAVYGFVPDGPYAGEYHVVLVVHDGDHDYVLDNITNEVFNKPDLDIRRREHL